METVWSGAKDQPNTILGKTRRDGGGGGGVGGSRRSSHRRSMFVNREGEGGRASNRSRAPPAQRRPPPRPPAASSPAAAAPPPLPQERCRGTWARVNTDHFRHLAFQNCMGPRTPRRPAPCRRQPAAARACPTGTRVAVLSCSSSRRPAVPRDGRACRRWADGRACPASAASAGCCSARPPRLPAADCAVASQREAGSAHGQRRTRARTVIGVELAAARRRRACGARPFSAVRSGGGRATENACGGGGDADLLPGGR
jgi:hypothetical protein